MDIVLSLLRYTAIQIIELLHFRKLSPIEHLLLRLRVDRRIGGRAS